MSGAAFGIHIGLAIPSCANRHAGPSQLAGAPHTGPAGRTYGLVNLPNETCASSSALRAVAARPESEEDRTRRADRKNDVTSFATIIKTPFAEGKIYATNTGSAAVSAATQLPTDAAYVACIRRGFSRIQCAADRSDDAGLTQNHPQSEWLRQRDATNN